MARRRHGHRQSGFKKMLKKWLPLPLKIGGAVAVAGPAINVLITDVQGNRIGEIGQDMLFAYTGVGTSGVDIPQLTRGIASIAGGLILIKIGSLLGRSL